MEGREVGSEQLTNTYLIGYLRLRQVLETSTPPWWLSKCQNPLINEYLWCFQGLIWLKSDISYCLPDSRDEILSHIAAFFMRSNRINARGTNITKSWYDTFFRFLVTLHERR